MPERAGHPTEALSAYLDGELDGTERAALERHLGGCGPCTDLLRDLRRLAAAAREEDIPPPPADLPARILRQIDAAAAAVRARPWHRRLPLAAAASLAALALLWIVWIREPRLRTPSPPLEKTMPESATEGTEAPAADARRDEADGARSDPGDLASGSAGDRRLLQEGEAGRMRAVGDAASEAAKKEARPTREARERQAADKVAAPPPPAIEPPPEARAGAGATASPVAGGAAATADRPEENRTADAFVAAPPAKEAQVQSPPPGAPAPASAPEPEAAATAARGKPQAGAEEEPKPSPSAHRDEERDAARAEAERLIRHVVQQDATAAPMAKSRAAEIAPAPAFVPAGGIASRGTLLFVGTDYRITLQQDGRLTLHADGYECTAAPAAGDGSERQRAEADLLGRALADVAAMADDVTSSRAGAPDADGSVGLEGTGWEDAATILPDDREPPWLLLLGRDADGNARARLAGPEGLAELQARLEALVRDHYDARLEPACGPPPAPFRRTPDAR